jgi:3-hydroxyisobutyrate dehydrogenase-like beta-hydroxyacid dehydrogenase
MRIGLIGVGLLGSALAERFLKAGHEVTGFDTNPAALDGVRAAGSGQEAASYGEVLVLCLPDSSISAAVIGSLIIGDTIVVDTTTGSPEEIERLGRRLARYVDATIAGSSQQVRGGEAVVMAGGSAADVDACRALFASFAHQTFHVGPCGYGARMKLVVNLVLGLNRAALAEGLAFAEAAGVDPALALEVLRSGPAYSTAMDRKGEKMLRRDWTPEARLAQHHKDVRLILEEARRNGIELPMSQAHDALLAAAEAAGFAASDNSAVLEAYLKKNTSRRTASGGSDSNHESLK